MSNPRFADVNSPSLAQVLAVLLLGFCGVLGAQAAPESAPAQEPPALKVGDKAVFVEGHDRWCVTVRTLADGPGAGQWAWISIDAFPARVLRVPVVSLTPQCP